MAEPSLIGGFDLGFQEQIDFFRAKIKLPTDRWDDIWQAAHDRAFVVAGATKADLLDDLAQAVDKAISTGTTLETFRQNFRKIVADHGWQGWTGEGTPGGFAWRTKVIYETNLRTSYAAGREAQLADPGLQKLMPYRRYVHNDSVLNPRPQHLAWNGLTLPHDHPFWKTHSPPNGWGCRCRVVAAIAPRKGDRTEPPENWNEVDAETGKLPGIDRGWGYAPGQSHVDELRRLAKEKQTKLPAPLRKALADEIAQAARQAADNKPQGMSAAEIRAELARLESQMDAESARNKKLLAMDRIQNEGGGGYSHYDTVQGATLEKYMPQQIALRRALFEAEWTPEVTTSRRAAWNAEMQKLVQAKKPATTKVLAEIQTRLGFTLAELKKALGK